MVSFCSAETGITRINTLNTKSCFLGEVTSLLSSITKTFTPPYIVSSMRARTLRKAVDQAPRSTSIIIKGGFLQFLVCVTTQSEKLNIEAPEP